MKSFEHGYLYDTPITHGLLISMRALGEFRGHQMLYANQFPEILETLRQVALVQSAESSNRIEGITVAADRIGPLVRKKTKPHDRSEQEVAGYRDVLASIHAGSRSMALSTELIQGWHRQLYRYTSTISGEWKKKDNAILEVLPGGRQVVRFRPVSALATPSAMAKLVSLFNQAINERKADPILLLATFVFDFECIHPFPDGNGRLGRLLTLLLLYHYGYEVGRYISLERIVEESKDTYYEALNESSRGWHEGQHDLRPWWNYFLGMLIAAYKEFEERVGFITTARGAKRESVRRAVERLPKQFSIADLQRTCPGISYPTLQRALRDLRQEGKIRCLGRGPDAHWEKIGG